MIFAATVEHAKEILSYLPKNSAALVTAETPAIDRQAIIKQFKNKELHYLVNVSVLTTGFDAPHVDVIAILRPTESVSLYQQIVGRGLRLYQGKNTLFNLRLRGPTRLFRPEVGSSQQFDPVCLCKFCPLCQFANIFFGENVPLMGKLFEH